MMPLQNLCARTKGYFSIHKHHGVSFLSIPNAIERTFVKLFAKSLFFVLSGTGAQIEWDSQQGAILPCRRVSCVLTVQIKGACAAITVKIEHSWLSRRKVGVVIVISKQRARL